MEVIYALIPGMIFLGLAMVGLLVWAVRRGQYEDFEGDANRILFDDEDNDRTVGNRAAEGVDDDRRNWPDAD